MVQRAPQVAAVVAMLFASGCESPARVKPWRHAPDPAAEAKAEPAAHIVDNAVDDAPPGSDHDVRANRGHTLRIALPADPGRLTPVVEPSLWAWRITVGTIFEPLLRYVPSAAGRPGHYEPRLARSWRVLPSGQAIQIELEPTAVFHDGSRLTSRDVQFSLDAVRTSHHGLDGLRAMLDDVAAIVIESPTELRLELKRPSGWALRALAAIPILPMHVYSGSLAAGGALVGTGPWRLVSAKPGVVHLGRAPKYWGPPAAIADLEFVYEPDAAAVLTAAKRGDFDIVPALIAAHWPEQANSPGVTAAFRPLELAPPRLRYLAMNAAHSPLNDVRVRHAFALLIDRHAIAKHVFGGLARPVLWPIWPGGPVDGVEMPAPAFDPATAVMLLDAAGWSDHDGDGIRDKDGKPLRLVLIGADHPAPNAGEPARQTERDVFVEAARRVGVVIDVRTGGVAASEGQWDLVEQAWSGLADAPIASLLSGPTRAPDPRIDHALDALAAAWDPALRQKRAAELVAALAETWPLAGIVADAPQGLVARRIQTVTLWDGWIDLPSLGWAAIP